MSVLEKLYSYICHIAQWRQLGQELKETREKLKQTEEALQFIKLALDQARDIVWWVDLKTGRYVAVNEAACRLLGYSREEMLTKHIYENLFPGFTQKMWHTAVNNVEKTKGGIFETDILTKDNRYIPTEAQVVHFAFNGKKYGFAVIRDLTERKKTEPVSLQTIIAQQEALLNNIPHSAWIKDGGFRYTAVNEAYARLCHRTREEMIGCTVFDIWPKEVAQKLHEEDLAMMESGEKVHLETLMQDPEGKTFWGEIFKTPINHEPSSRIFAGSVGIAQDISDRKAAEKELQTRFATTFEQTAVGMAHITPDGKWLRFNRKYCEILGYTESELLALNAKAITHPDDLPTDIALVQQLLQKEIPSFSREKRYIRKDGSIVWTQWTVSSVWSDSGDHQYNIAIIEDISQRKAFEQSLVETNRQLSLKNEALLDFVLIASHDLQEPLRKIMLFSERLKCRSANQLDQDVLFNLDRITQSANRMHELIDGLSAYSRLMIKPQQFSLLNLNDIINDVLSDFEKQIQETGAEFDIAILPRIPGDKIRMRQLFHNLISNALKFRRKDIRPLIRIYPEMMNPSKQEAPSWVQLVVEDNGMGFEEKYAQTIFKMFERLHSNQNIPGIGIGLAICKKIVECHGGAIYANSQPGQGSHFFISLPLSLSALPSPTWSDMYEHPTGEDLIKMTMDAD